MSLERGERIKASTHFDGRKFVNPVETRISRPGTISDTLWQWVTGNEMRRPPYTLGPFEPDLAAVRDVRATGLQVIWMGHSTVLLDLDGKRFLIDPVWSDRCSPIKGMGPRRFFDVPVPLEKITHVDGVVISHDHYDHLDEPTIKKLAELDPTFYVPLGVGAYLEEWGINPTRIKELDWWDEIRVGHKHKLACTPARHFSGRGFFDRDKTLWASWVLTGPVHRVYFGGDSGMFPGFKEIGVRYGPFDLTMLEIGAYHPNWGEIHLGPENACRAQLDLKGKVLMPIHWGTFELAFHAWDDPVKELIDFSRETGVALLLPRPGKAYRSPILMVNSRWWVREGKEPGKEATGFHNLKSSGSSKRF